MSDIVPRVNATGTINREAPERRRRAVGMSSADQTPDSDELERAAGQIEAPLASLVGDYEESQSDSPAQAKGCLLYTSPSPRDS